MSKEKTPFCPAAVLFVLYYILVPVFLAIMREPFIGSLFSVTSLAYLALGVVLFLRKAGFWVAVFSLIGGALQISPIVYFFWRIFSGATGFSDFISPLNAFCQAAAFGLITCFAVAQVQDKKGLVQKLWFLPIIFSGASFLLYCADRVWQFFLYEKVNYLPLALNTVIVILPLTALVLLSFWYKRLVADK